MLSLLLSYLLLYRYIALALVVLCAAAILPLPVNTLLLATGAFANQGYFDFTQSIFVAISANVIGDMAAFWFTRKYGPIAFKKLRIKTSPNLLRAEQYIQTHAGATIFITRFVGVIGTATNILAGLADVSPIKFLTFDLLGNSIQIGMIIGLGYLVGTYWQDYSDTISIVGEIALVLILILTITKTVLARKKR